MLRGRRSERRTIDAMLNGARSGDSGVLILRGDPGIGKTALLHHAAAEAADFTVLRGAGVESEAELPFAGLHMLLGPVLDRLDALPGPQRAALSAAFGLDTGTPGDRFMIGAGVLSLLAEVAEKAPLLCLVDDAHWLDRASTDALLFAARRLGREGVAIVLAVRDYAGALPSSGLPELRLSGLDAESAAALLTDQGTSLPAADLERLITETGGNPLALMELPAVVSSLGPQLGPMPLTSRVQDAFHHQIRALPVPSRTAVLLAAAAGSCELPVILRAAATMNVDVADLQPAEDRGLLTVSGATIAFRHPLVRAAVYHGAPLTLRLAAHAALADAYAAQRDADRHAWHLSVAATDADERVADELERAAGRAAARNGHAAAAAGYERAAQLSEDPDAALRRLTLACEAGADAGRLDWARARAERVLPDVTDPDVRVRLIEVQAAADFGQGALKEAYELLSSAAATSDDADRAFWMRVRAFHAVWAAPTDLTLLAEAVDALGTERPLAWLARWATAVVLDRDTTGFPSLDATLADARTAAAGPRALIEVASRAFVGARDESTAEIAADLTATARADGVISAVPAGLGLLTLSQTLLGRHREALVTGTEGLDIARDTGQQIWVSYTAGALAYLAAIEGDKERCRHHADEAALDRSAPAGSLAGITWAQAALALLDLGHGRIQEAFDRLQAIAEGPTRHQGAVVRTVPDLIEAAVRLGRPDDASAPLAFYARWAKAMQRPWIDARLLRCRAMTSPAPERHYQRALKLDDRPFENARTQLLYGEWLRRSRRKNDAQTHLNAALQTFDEIGSAPWAARARAELGATGAAVSRTETSDAFAALTPQELQITRLAAQGVSNRDIAAQLFISPRTVAYHLYKAYPKLGINSRSDLAALL